MSISSTETPSEWTLSVHSGTDDRKFSLRSLLSKEGGDEVYTNGHGRQNSVGVSAADFNDYLPSNVMVTQSTVDYHNIEESGRENQQGSSVGLLGEDIKENDCPSPASSIGGTYAVRFRFLLVILSLWSKLEILIE